MDRQIIKVVDLVREETEKKFNILLDITLDKENKYCINIKEISLKDIFPVFFNFFIKENELKQLSEVDILLVSKNSEIQLKCADLEKLKDLDPIIKKVLDAIKDWRYRLEENTNMIVSGLKNSEVEVYPTYRGTHLIFNIQKLIDGNELLQQFEYEITPKINNRKAIIIKQFDENNKIYDFIKVEYFADKVNEELFFFNLIEGNEEEISLVGTEDDIATNIYVKIKTLLNK